MARRRKKSLPELGEHQIFGDEAAAQVHAELAELRSLVDDLNARVNAQFTSIAAHAEISQHEVQLARDEARADMERSRDTLIGLLDQLRHDVLPAASGGEAPGPAPDLPAPLPPSTVTTIDGQAISERFDAVESAVGELADTLDRSLARQRHLADTMSAFIDTMLAQQAADPIVDTLADLSIA